MWITTSEGIRWRDDAEGYVATSINDGTRGAWTTCAWTDSGRWLGVDRYRQLDHFEPKPRCIFDE